MAQAALGPQSGRARGDAMQRFIGMQAALHEQRTLAFANELHRSIRRGVAVRLIDHLEPTDIDPVGPSGGDDFGGGSHQDRDDDAGVRRLVAPRSDVSSQG